MRYNNIYPVQPAAELLNRIAEIDENAQFFAEMLRINTVDEITETKFRNLAEVFGDKTAPVSLVLEQF